MGGLNPRLAGWVLFVCVFAALNYWSHFSDERPATDFAYQWESSIFGLVQYALIFGIVLLLGIGLDRRRFLALRRPRSWWRAARISALVILAVLVAAAAAAPLGNPEEEQGLIPEHFDSDRIVQFAAFAAIVTVIAPIVEELMFRGAGYALLERYGRTAAVILVGIAFALIHGLVAGFPVIATFGIGLAYRRSRTESVYPCILIHGSFTAAGLSLCIAT